MLRQLGNYCERTIALPMVSRYARQSDGSSGALGETRKAPEAPPHLGHGRLRAGGRARLGYRMRCFPCCGGQVLRCYGMIGASVLLAILALRTPPSVQAQANEIALHSGDRIVWIGSTLIEREPRYGYWELLLTSRFPDKNLSFRNLGWSGDTVWTESRGGFGSPADGFRKTKELIGALQPTLIFVCYGTNEAFAGPEGLARFRDGLKKLLDMLAQSKARLVIVTPPPMDYNRYIDRLATEDYNRSLALYASAMIEMAKTRNYPVVDLFSLMRPVSASHPRSDNGLHWTEVGYWESAQVFEHGLGLPPRTWELVISADGSVTKAEGTKVSKVQATPTRLRFELTDAMLPLPPHPRQWSAASDRQLVVRGLPPKSRWTLQIDGKTIVSATGAAWEKGVRFLGPEHQQTEALRQAIREKNELFFHRWRPQNDTYLFGFRKHEQGQNAKEVPMFEPLIEAQEKRIAQLRQPKKWTYELIQVAE